MESKPALRAVGYIQKKVTNLDPGDTVIINGFRTTIEQIDGEVFYINQSGGLKKLSPNQKITKVVFAGDSDEELLTLRGRLQRLWHCLKTRKPLN